MKEFAALVVLFTAFTLCSAPVSACDDAACKNSACHKKEAAAPSESADKEPVKQDAAPQQQENAADKAGESK